MKAPVKSGKANKVAGYSNIRCKAKPSARIQISPYIVITNISDKSLVIIACKCQNYATVKKKHLYSDKL